MGKLIKKDGSYLRLPYSNSTVIFDNGDNDGDLRIILRQNNTLYYFYNIIEGNLKEGWILTTAGPCLLSFLKEKNIRFSIMGDINEPDYTPGSVLIKVKGDLDLANA